MTWALHLPLVLVLKALSRQVHPQSIVAHRSSCPASVSHLLSLACAMVFAWRLKVTGEHLALACDALVRECLGKGSTDNITAMAVSLGSGPPPRPSALGGKALFSDGQ